MTKNKYVMISNELLDALCLIRVSGEERQIFDFILRKTYGYNKQEDEIALSQFVKGTGMTQPHIIRAVKKLIEKNMIAKIGNKYKINEASQAWKPLPKKARLPLPKMAIKVAKIGNLPLPKLDDTKDNKTKDKRHPIIPLKKESASNQVNDVWDFYLEESKTRERLTPERIKKIKKRLDIYTPDDLREAIKRCFGDRFYRGENKTGWRANADYVFRNDENIDKLLNLPPPKTATSEYKTVDQLRQEGKLW